MITTLGTILSEASDLPVYVRRTASGFSTQQLLRPNGVMGFCESVCGEEESSGETIKLDKLQQVSKTLLSVPAKMAPKVRPFLSDHQPNSSSEQDYYEKVTPRIIQLLSEKVPVSYRKIASFTLSQMLGSDSSFQHRTEAAPVVYSNLHLPFSKVSSDDSPSTDPANAILPSTALSRLLSLVANCDPSPELISNLLTPVIAPLYSLFYHLGTQKAADPVLKESVQGLLLTWGKIVEGSKAVALFWELIQHGQPQYWSISLDGTVRLISR